MSILRQMEEMIRTMRRNGAEPGRVVAGHAMFDALKAELAPSATQIQDSDMKGTADLYVLGLRVERATVQADRLEVI